MKRDKHLYPSIEKVPVKELTSGWSQPLETMNGNSHAIILDDGKDKTIVQFCSDQYTVTLNENVIGEVQKVLKGAGLEFRESHRLWNKARFKFQFEITNSKPITIGNKKDIIRPMLMVKNSYDGGLKFGFEMGFMRLVCTNGMTVPVKDMPNAIVKKMHTASIKDLVEGDKLAENLKEFAMTAAELDLSYKELAENTFDLTSVEERVQNVIEETGFPKRRAEDVINRLYQELDLLEATPNDWLLYNAFNYTLQHSPDVNMPFHKEDSMDRKVLETLLYNI